MLYRWIEFPPSDSIQSHSLLIPRFLVFRMWGAIAAALRIDNFIKRLIPVTSHSPKIFFIFRFQITTNESQICNVQIE